MCAHVVFPDVIIVCAPMIEFDSKQRDPGWVCPECHLTRGPDRIDPCLGKLPGVLFACCGHGGKTHSHDGYIYFENGTTIRFERLTRVDRTPEKELREAKDLKQWLGE